VEIGLAIAHTTELCEKVVARVTGRAHPSQGGAAAGFLTQPGDRHPEHLCCSNRFRVKLFRADFQVRRLGKR
jgi:hypothetical protein